MIRSLSAMLGLNVLISEDVPATQVTYTTSFPVNRDEVAPILEAILEAEGLVLVNRGPVAQVVPLEGAPPTGPVSSGRTLPTPRPVGLVTQIVPLDYISSEEALEVLGQLGGPLARIEALPRSNGLMITDHASNVAAFLELIRQLDARSDGEAGRRTYVYRLKHANAAELATTLSQLYGLRLVQTAARPRVQALSDQSLSSSLQGFRERDVQALDQRRSDPFQPLSSSAPLTGAADTGPDAASEEAGPGR
ncbi:MAG: hypothetical protein JSU98_11975, partial [Gemmatimonadales bacterium]